jgi:hypothetical protein
MLACLWKLNVAPSSVFPLHFPSFSLCPRQGGEPSAIAPASRRALTVAPQPLPSCPELRQDLADLVDHLAAPVELEVSRIAASAHPKCHRSSAVVRFTVASTAPHPSAFPRSCPLFSIMHRCSGEDATTNAGPAEPEHGRAPSRHGRRRCSLAAKLDRFTLAGSSSMGSSPWS